MKKINYLWLLIIIILIVNGCGGEKDKLIINSTKNIIKITIDTWPGDSSSLKITEDKNQITEITNYINELELKKTTKDLTGYAGMSYFITVYFQDKTSIEYVHFGNTLFKGPGKDWYEMSYEQAEKIENIYKGLSNK